MPRFILIENDPEYPAVDETRWWFDTERPLPPEVGQAYKVIQVYSDRNANDYVRHAALQLLFTDQCEYYAVCGACFDRFRSMQWSGGTRGGGDWRECAARFLERHLKQKGWCEFCDPAFGNGGWSRKGKGVG